MVSNAYEDEGVSNGWCFIHFKPWKQKIEIYQHFSLVLSRGSEKKNFRHHHQKFGERGDFHEKFFSNEKKEIPENLVLKTLREELRQV